MMEFRQTESRDVPFSIRLWKEELSQDQLAFKRAKLFDVPLTTTDDWQYSEVIDIRVVNSVILQIINRHATNTLKYQVLGCINPPDWEPLQPEQTLSTTEKIKGETLTDPYAFVKVGVKSAVAGSAAIADGYAAGKGRR